MTDDPAFPDWKEIFCGICGKSVMGHSLEQLRHCAVKSGRRLGEDDDYLLLPAHLHVPVGQSTEIQKDVLEITCPICGKRALDHSREQTKECAAEFGKRIQNAGKEK